MNAKQRYKNRDTAQNLRFANGEWDSKNRRIVPTGTIEKRRELERKASRAG